VEAVEGRSEWSRPAELAILVTGACRTALRRAEFFSDGRGQAGHACQWRCRIGRGEGEADGRTRARRNEIAEFWYVANWKIWEQAWCLLSRMGRAGEPTVMSCTGCHSCTALSVESIYTYHGKSGGTVWSQRFEKSNWRIEGVYRWLDRRFRTIRTPR
jgi:hypothetical protein